MNCKPGDLAVFIKSVAGNEGKIVTCVRFVGPVPMFVGDDYWLINTDVPSLLGNRVSIARDCQLRPIRPGDISDEEVRDLYLPKVPEAA